LRLGESTKFDKDLINVEPLQHSATQRFIPLVQNQCGKRGLHYESTLREFASLFIKRASGCRLLQGPLIIPPTVALNKVLSTWGARLTRTTQRELAAQVIRGVQVHKAAATFLKNVVFPRICAPLNVCTPGSYSAAVCTPGSSSSAVRTTIRTVPPAPPSS
jgi:hypothetical protein